MFFRLRQSSWKANGFCYALMHWFPVMIKFYFSHINNSLSVQIKKLKQKFLFLNGSFSVFEHKSWIMRLYCDT